MTRAQVINCFMNCRVCCDVSGTILTIAIIKTHKKPAYCAVKDDMLYGFSSLFVLQLIKQKIVMCRQLWGCESFVYVLEYLLTIGNYLNQHAGKEKSKGFRLSSLTKV